jgi:hypothetical protein
MAVLSICKREALNAVTAALYSRQISSKRSVVGSGSVLQAEFESRWGNWIFFNYLILPAALGPGVYSAPNRNEHQK